MCLFILYVYTIMILSLKSYMYVCIVVCAVVCCGINVITLLWYIHVTLVHVHNIHVHVQWNLR